MQVEPWLPPRQTAGAQDRTLYRNMPPNNRHQIICATTQPLHKPPNSWQSLKLPLHGYCFKLQINRMYSCSERTPADCRGKYKIRQCCRLRMYNHVRPKAGEHFHQQSTVLNILRLGSRDELLLACLPG